MESLEKPKESPLKHDRSVIRYIVIAMLFAALCLEGYYILVLRETIRRQTEDLRTISVQLQQLKSVRETLKEELSTTKTGTGDNYDGDATQR